MSETEFDIIVVGGGGAGLMAAYSAARFGRSVIVLEKQPQVGGTTALSVGTICTSLTPHQKAAGIRDTPCEHFEDLGKCAGALQSRDNLGLRRLLVDNVPQSFQVLLDLGVEFVGPFAEPPHRHSRLHAIVPHSRGYIHHLVRGCRRQGVVIRTGAPVTGLIKQGGRVAGVETGSTGSPKKTVRARDAVILASGDFSSAPRQFKERFMSGALLEIGGINPASTGDGQSLGEKVGGAVVNGDIAWGPEIRFVAPPRPRLIARIPPWRIISKSISAAMKNLPDWALRPLLLSYVTTFLAPSHKLFEAGAVLVNLQGQRFVDERQRPQDEIGRQPEQKAFIVFDAAIAEKFSAWPNFVSTAPGVGYAYLKDYEGSRRDICHKAQSWSELAKKIGVPEDRLEETVQGYNGTAADEGRAALMQPPFYALGPAKSWIVFTEGGLAVNEQLQVLTAEGDAIPGLYAAGSAGQGGAILEGHGHHLGWAFTSGRLAGINAARLPSEVLPIADDGEAEDTGRLSPAATK